jgi:hypothetical protein
MNLAILTLTPGQVAMCFAPALINLWAIWHAATRRFPSRIEQAVWIVVCMFVPVIGGLAYLCFGLKRSKRIH